MVIAYKKIVYFEAQLGVPVKHTLNLVTAVTLVAAAAGCTTQPERIAVTASGRPEAIFAGVAPEEVQSRLTQRCLDRGHVVVTSSASQVVCELEMGAMSSVLTQALIGNSYSTEPKTYMRLTIVPVTDGARVQAYTYSETQMVGGQVNKMELNGNQQFNSVQGFLNAVGGVAP